MIVSETEIRVRYGETDQMGVVHHSTYIMYFEIGRTELLRNLGTTYRKMEDQGIMLPVVSVNCNFIGPAKYDDLLTIKTYLKEIPGVKINFYYEIFNGKKRICEGHSILAFTNAKSKRPMRPPGWFMDILKKNF